MGGDLGTTYSSRKLGHFKFSLGMPKKARNAMVCNPYRQNSGSATGGTRGWYKASVYVASTVCSVIGPQHATVPVAPAPRETILGLYIFIIQ